MGRLQNTVAVVTGAGGPTGQAIARRLAEEGAAIVLNVHRGAERARAARDSIAQAGGRATVIEADAARVDGARRIIDGAVELYGHVDILVNNASAMSGAPLPELTEAQIDEVWDANLRSAFYCAQQAARVMIPRRSGRIINLSSIAAGGSLHNANYAVAKAGVEGLTRTLALELGRHNITVNCVSPGLIDSEKTRQLPPWIFESMTRPSPMRVAVEPIDVANAVLFFGSDEARYITGQVLHVSGGLDVVVRGMQEP